MNKKLTALFSTVAISVLSSCANINENSRLETSNDLYVTPLNVQSPAIESLLTTDIEKLWSQDFHHYQEGLLIQVAHAISSEAAKGSLMNYDLDKLTFYLRIYSSFGPEKGWLEGTEQALNQALVDLQNMAGFYQITPETARLHENYAVALYRLYFLDSMQPLIADHIKPLAQLINLYAHADLRKSNNDGDASQAKHYALWEILRASAILPYEAKRKNKAENLNAILGKGELQQSLLNFIGSSNAVIANDNWPVQHASWALAQYYNIYNKQYWNSYDQLSSDEQEKLDKNTSSLPEEALMTKLDNQVWSALEGFTTKYNKAPEALKTLFSIPYVVSTFRGKSECSEDSLAGRCISPTIEQALPINHTCSDSLFILTQAMTVTQLNNSCQKLIAQEKEFHQKLATNKQPVANDFNDKLRVVIFENAAEYNKYGQLVFDIHTDNGGMYIEGTTQDPDNIATFYSYEHFWVRPEFKVWNLNHEYVHYLDGRFIKYDTFNHFPSHMVWWSEGLAEFISKANDNPKAFKVLRDTEQEKWLSLMDVFNTEYKDGTTQVYKWGYLAVRYMYENHPKQYQQLGHFLKTDFFDGYKKLLEQSGEKYQQGFQAWLVEHKNTTSKVAEATDPQQPRQFYRYTYKDYLQPKHLIESSRHMHWQYWHANALKTQQTIASQK